MDLFPAAHTLANIYAVFLGRGRMDNYSTNNQTSDMLASTHISKHIRSPPREGKDGKLEHNQPNAWKHKH